MQSYSSKQEICGTCDHWRGERTLDECQFVYVMPDAKGVCALSNKIYEHAKTCEEQAGVKWKHDLSNRSHLEEVNCWEYTGCGFEEGGPNAARHGVCSAYPSHGRLCTALEDTQCQLGHNSINNRLPMPRKRNCLQCGFFNNALSHAD